MIDFKSLFSSKISSKHIIDEKAVKAFHREIEFLAFKRHKIINIVFACILIVLIYINISFSGLWGEQTARRFVIIDAIFLLYAIIVYILLTRYPLTVNFEVNVFHVVINRLSVLAYMTWIALASATENTFTSGLPTFTIGMLFIATLFIFRGFYLAFVFFSGLLTLFIAMSTYGFDIIAFIKNHILIFVFLAIAVIVSRILYSNFYKEFTALWHLEKANFDLEQRYRDRSQELTSTNERLRKEIVEREKYEKQLRKEIKRAEESDKLKSAFLANLSHEIRTPLNGIVGFAELADSRELNEEKRKKYTFIIRKNSNQLLKIIDNIMDISMIESDQMKLEISNVKAVNIFQSAFDIYKTFIESSQITPIDFNYKIEHNLENKMISTDTSRVQQVVQNLLDNAFKFTEEGSVYAEVCSYDEGIFAFIQDTGVGIDNENIDIIFERFRQGIDGISRLHSGTGLGLSIAKGILDKLGGRIWIDNSYKMGARFCFTLPFDFNENINAQDISTTIFKKSLLKTRILIISASDGYFQLLSKRFITSADKILRATTQKEVARILRNTNVSLIIVCPNSELGVYGPILRYKNSVLDEFQLLAICGNEDEKEFAESSNVDYIFNTPVNISKLISSLSNFNFVSD